MALIPCKECGHQVSSIAAACPQCGAPVAPPPAKSNGALTVLAWVVMVPVVVFVYFAVVGAMDERPETIERRQAKAQYEGCLQQLRDELTPSTNRDLIRVVCAGMRRKFVQRFGHEP